MYKPYYDLLFDPFQLRHESAFFWAGKWHTSILEELRAAILEKRGFYTLTSPEGYGKTCLTEALVERLEERVESSFITLKNDNIISFFNTILTGFGVGTKVATKIQFYLQITDCLQKIRHRNRIGFLVVDNAHFLSQELLEELRHVSNIENDGVKLINVLLVGNEGVNELLKETQNSALRQKVMFHSDIPPLSDVEIQEYVEHRLRVAGATAKIFSDNALKQLAIYTDGVFKVLNVLCDTALSLGCKRGAKTIDDQIILDSAKKLKIQPSQKRADIQGDIRKNPPRNIDQEDNFSESDRLTSLKKKKNWTLTVVVSSLVSIVCLFYLFPELLKSPLTGSSSTVEIGVMIPETTADIESKLVEGAAKEIIENTLKVEGIQVEESVFDVGDKIPKIPSKTAIHSEKSQNDSKITSKSDINKTETQAHLDLIVNKIFDGEERNLKVEMTDESRMNAIKDNVNETVVVDNESGQSTSGVVSEVIVPQNIDESENQIVQNDKIITIIPVSSKVVVFLLEGKLIIETKPNSSEITKGGLLKLNMFSTRLLQHPKAIIQVEGYISSKNNSLENIKLSERRANIVRDYLLAQGIDAQQIIVKGMGNQNPRASNDTYEGRKKNRRVEISVLNDLCHPDE